MCPPGTRRRLHGPAFAAFFASEVETWGRVIREAWIKLE
jgi:hypothetical protein